MSDIVIGNRDLIRQVQENPGPFLPVCFCLDTSASMRMMARDGTGADGMTRLQSVQDGLDRFFVQVSQDENACDAVHAAIVTFDTEVRVVQNFGSLGGQQVPRLELGEEGTALGPGVNLSLDLIEEYNEFLSGQGAERCPPVLILMSDGIDNIGRSAFLRAEQRIGEMVDAGRLSVFPFGIGVDASLERLSQLSPETAAQRLEESQIARVFNWLIMSTIQLSREMRVSKRGIEKYNPESWGDPLR